MSAKAIAPTKKSSGVAHIQRFRLRSPSARIASSELPRLLMLLRSHAASQNEPQRFDDPLGDFDIPRARVPLLQFQLEGVRLVGLEDTLHLLSNIRVDDDRVDLVVANGAEPINI